MQYGKQSKFFALLGALLLWGACSAQPKTNGGSSNIPSGPPPEWQVVGVEGFTTGQARNPSLAFNAQGVPYVAYINASNGEKAAVMRFNGTEWEPVGPSGGFSAGQADSPSLAINSAGEPYVAYGDIGSGYAATVMKFTNGAWTNVGARGFTSGGAFETSLAFNAGVPYVAYGNGANGDKATVKRFTNGVWEAVGSAGFSAGGARSLSLAFSDDMPYVAYLTYSGAKAALMRYTGTGTTEWEAVGPAGGFSEDEADSPSLAFSGDVPYVAYGDRNKSNHATLMRYTGTGTTGWVAVGDEGFSAGRVGNTSLAFHDGVPYVVYRDEANGRKATLMRFNGLAWEAVGPAEGFSAGEANSLQLVFNGGVPYVVYRDEANGNKATVMKFE